VIERDEITHLDSVLCRHGLRFASRQLDYNLRFLYDLQLFAASGAEAVQVVENSLVPDVILTDYHLPFEMTGDQVVAEITTRLGFRPPTIMLASVQYPDAEKVMSVADRVFEKPADMLLVVREIQHLLSARSIETSDFPPRARVAEF
jgi:CheY-like chemotaxis protein